MARRRQFVPNVDHTEGHRPRLLKRDALSYFVLSNCGLLACCAPKEPVRVDVPVAVDAAQLELATTDLDYEVEVSEARVMGKDFTFAIAGEVHAASLIRRSYEWLIPDAVAHPGHYQGGDITGEMPGLFLLDWLPGENTELGEASLIVGHYHSANFIFFRATETDLEQNDPLLGHTALLRGTAKKNGQSVSFLALIDSPKDRHLVGIPFELDLEETSKVVLQLQLKTVDSLEGDTLFDGIDFLGLDEDADGELEIAPAGQSEKLEDAYNLLRRTLQTHDHFEIKAVSLD